MTTISADEMQQDVTGWLGRVAAGETLVITQTGRPVAELRPYPNAVPSLRPAGLAAGEFRTPDDFDAPLPEDILADFEGR